MPATICRMVITRAAAMAMTLKRAGGATGMMKDGTTLADGVDARVSRLEAKLGVPRVCVIFAYRNQLPLQDRQPQLFKAVPCVPAP